MFLIAIDIDLSIKFTSQLSRACPFSDVVSRVFHVVLIIGIYLKNAIKSYSQWPLVHVAPCFSVIIRDVFATVFESSVKPAMAFVVLLVDDCDLVCYSVNDEGFVVVCYLYAVVHVSFLYVCTHYLTEGGTSVVLPVKSFQWPSLCRVLSHTSHSQPSSTRLFESLSFGVNPPTGGITQRRHWPPLCSNSSAGLPQPLQAPKVVFVIVFMALAYHRGWDIRSPTLKVIYN